MRDKGSGGSQGLSVCLSSYQLITCISSLRWLTSSSDRSPRNLGKHCVVDIGANKCSEQRDKTCESCDQVVSSSAWNTCYLVSASIAIKFELLPRILIRGLGKFERFCARIEMSNRTWTNLLSQHQIVIKRFLTK